MKAIFCLAPNFFFLVGAIAGVIYLEMFQTLLYQIKIMCISLEALVATEFSEIFSGRQLHQVVKTLNN